MYVHCNSNGVQQRNKKHFTALPPNFSLYTHTQLQTKPNTNTSVVALLTEAITDGIHFSRHHLLNCVCRKMVLSFMCKAKAIIVLSSILAKIFSLVGNLVNQMRRRKSVSGACAFGCIAKLLLGSWKSKKSRGISPACPGKTDSYFHYVTTNKQ